MLKETVAYYSQLSNDQKQIQLPENDAQGSWVYGVIYPISVRTEPPCCIDFKGRISNSPNQKSHSFRLLPVTACSIIALAVDSEIIRKTYLFVVCRLCSFRSLCKYHIIQKNVNQTILHTEIKLGVAFYIQEYLFS